MVDSKQQWKAWLYLSPAIVLLLVFTVWPIINTVRISLLEGYNSMAAMGGTQFNIGFGNFLKVMEFPDFLVCLKNTILLCFLTVPISTLLALLIAVALNSIRPLQKFLQTIFFLPYVTNSIAIGMVFAAMFNIIGLRGGAGVTAAEGTIVYEPGVIYNLLTMLGLDAGQIIGLREGMFADTWGIVNNVLMVFGLEPINWANQGSSYVANIIVMTVYIVWNALPFKILILLGGLQSINKQYYDAARVDGTSRRRVLTKITVPLLSPMLAYVIITGFIGGFKEYSSIVGIFGETMGPPAAAGRLNTMVGFIYDSLETSSQGKASAAALILFGIILVVTMINLQVSKKKVHY